MFTNGVFAYRRFELGTSFNIVFGPKRSSAVRRNIAAQNNEVQIQRLAQNLFGEEELTLVRTIDGFNQGEDAIEVLCGCTCTDKKYEITESTDPRRMTPKEFKSHARSGVRRWKSNIWVRKEGKKVSLQKSGLWRYYKYAANDSNWDRRRSDFVHRDEFLGCSKCQKERRTNCEDEEERVGRKCYGRCPHAPTCKGFTSCVCSGCSMCRFKDCDCQTCVDYIQNVEP
ncbi:putative developmental regulator, ULTRAPETALA [Rosa chinensis]|uniref:Putative developmental regulator, ULTRAPETALA n=1 Tax=Rosa chinensis TaxID=74649 RepID=A0A2P6QB46_ROSCH|nr:putative developmental regulator, ULTRAPETALA [Rosa chinensis]